MLISSLRATEIEKEKKTKSKKERQMHTQTNKHTDMNTSRQGKAALDADLITS